MYAHRKQEDGAIPRNQWTRRELLTAFRLYCELPFGQMHSKNQHVIRLAGAIDRTPSALAMKLTNIASLDPAIFSTGRKGLTGASRSDRAMWAEMTNDWERFLVEADTACNEFQSAFPDVIAGAELNESSGNFAGQTREAVVALRVGQSFFRESVLSAYNYRCCISGVSKRELLIASHIVPWRVDVNNRLNPKNGLCLSAIHDRAFDAGLISVAANHTLMISKKLRVEANSFVEDTFLKYDGKAINIPEKFYPDSDFLGFHRRKVFRV
jgi:putative restriction endonuclease